MSFFRRKLFPAKPLPPKPEPEPEFMQPRVDIEDVPISQSMQELAHGIIRNPAFDSICRRLRSDQLNLLLSTTPDDQSTREKCYQRISALDDIVLALAALGYPESKVHPSRVTKR